jgi:hypothetical protein
MKTRITVNKATILVHTPHDALELFDQLRDNSGWSDTGGGWRGIYRQLESLLNQFIIDWQTIEHKKPYDCYLKIELADD